MPDPLKGPAQWCQCLKMTHCLQWVRACSHERAEKWASYQNRYWQGANSRCWDKNKWKMLLEYNCVLAYHSVFQWYCGLGAPELEISSLSREFVMDFLPIVYWAAWTSWTLGLVKYTFYEEITFFFSFKLLFLNVSYSWNSQKLFSIDLPSVSCDHVEVCLLTCFICLLPSSVSVFLTKAGLYLSHVDNVCIFLLVNENKSKSAHRIDLI